MSRPAILDPLFRSLRSFKGVGPQLGALLNRYFGGDGHDAIALDLVMHMPSGAVDRRRMDPVAAALHNHIATLKVHIDRHVPPPPGRRHLPYRVKTHDDTGELDLVFFNAKGEWVHKALPVGEERYVSGTIGFFQGQKQMTHPDHIVAPDDFGRMPLVEPVYRLTQGLTARQMSRLVQQVLDLVPEVPEWIDDARRVALGWPSFRDAMRAVHAPGAPVEVELWAPARMRLAYDEYLANQMALRIVRATTTGPRGVSRSFTGELTSRVEAALPFSLTDGQRLAIADIRGDLAAPARMSRLLQGDVGSGKTAVALMAMAAVAESGAQSALMSPTEILATQHYRTLTPICVKARIGIELLTGKMSAADRRAALDRLASGESSIAVGTHALFQSNVAFHDLGLTVVDEQHRFGVHQRLALSQKGSHTDLLVMTATPIPRTLVLTHFGDMAVSVLKEKPAGRQPIDTAVLDIAEYPRVVQRLKKRIEEGAQAFWVCPLVEESELVELVSAEDRFAELRKHLGDTVALVHGRLAPAQKQAEMERFARGDTRVLVATTVIEVGVDVPSASIMIVEHAERFGLAQLHQLRGRVGRGAARSACLLLYGEPLTETARARLETMKATEDGFVIAEKDLELRGQGDLLGTRQSGMPGYRLAVPDVHRHLLEWAHDDARDALAQNPHLLGSGGEALRVLLYLFRKDLALPLIRAG